MRFLKKIYSINDLLTQRLRFQAYKQLYKIAPSRFKPKHASPMVLLYHHISKISNHYLSELGCTIHPRDFAAHIRYLSQNYDLVPFSKIVSNPQIGQIAITFDDGYQSFYTEALPVLERYNCPAKIYVTYDNIKTNVNWLNKLSYLLMHFSQIELSNLAQKALNQLAIKPKSINKFNFINHFHAKRTIEEIDKAYESIKPMQEPRLYLSEHELRELALHPLIEIGSHGKNHSPLARLDEQDLEKEVVESFNDLSALLNGKVSGFSIPFGTKSQLSHKAISTIQKISPYIVSAYGGFLRTNNNQSSIKEINRIPVWGNLGTLWHQMNIDTTP